MKALMLIVLNFYVGVVDVYFWDQSPTNQSESKPNIHLKYWLLATTNWGNKTAFDSKIGSEHPTKPEFQYVTWCIVIIFTDGSLSEFIATKKRLLKTVLKKS